MANDEILKKITAQWYNGFTTSMGQTTDNFQIFQPFVPLPKASGEIKLPTYMNIIPKESLSYQGADGLKFYGGFRDFLACLEPTRTNNLVAVIGEQNWEKFMTYIFDEHLDDKISKWPTLFRRWAMRHCPSRANSGASAIVRLILHPIAFAQVVMTDLYTKDDVPRPATWKLNYEELIDLLRDAPSLEMDFSSESSSSNIDRTWAKGKIGFKHSIFSGSASAEAERISSKFASNSITITGKFDHLTLFRCLPGTWYSRDATDLAFLNREGRPWRNNEWGDFFGESGQLKRFASNLLMCSGMDLTVKSNVMYSDSEQNTIKTKAKAGFWPFYVKSEGDTTTTTNFDESGKLSMNIKSPSDLPLILGLNQMPLAQYIKNDA